MTHDVLHGDLSAAVVDNAFLLLGLPTLAIWLLVRWRRGEPLMPVPAIAAVVVAALAWTIVRNWPGFPLVPTLLGG
jgi:MFS superfamily sulfate permease-like transporter